MPGQGKVTNSSKPKETPKAKDSKKTSKAKESSSVKDPTKPKFSLRTKFTSKKLKTEMKISLAKNKPSKEKKAPRKSVKFFSDPVIRKLATWGTTSRLVRKLARKAAKQKATVRTIFQQPRIKYVEKKIGGEKNGNTRIVRVGRKRKAFYPTDDNRRRSRVPISKKVGKVRIRSSLTCGRIAINLCGRHRGKRVVILKRLVSGLLLVTGPYILNHVPIRRLHPKHLIATSTKLDLSKIEIPNTLNDRYFKRERKPAPTKDTTAKKPRKKRFVPSEERKKDQVKIDKQILGVIKQHPDKSMLRAYLGSYFGLENGQAPHKIKF